jgi:hypothetical protein
MPTLALIPLLLTASVVALVLLWRRVRSGLAGALLVAEVGGTTLALAVLLYGLIMPTHH